MLTPAHLQGEAVATCRSNPIGSEMRCRRSFQVSLNHVAFAEGES